MANHGDVLFSISVFFSDYYLIAPACIFAFIAAHAVGQGAVIWVFISEIFPNRHRAEGQSLGSFTHWMFAGLLTTFFPKMASSLPPGYVFSFFAGMMCLQLLWVKMIVPETKNVPLEELQKEMGARRQRTPKRDLLFNHSSCYKGVRPSGISHCGRKTAKSHL